MGATSFSEMSKFFADHQPRMLPHQGGEVRAAVLCPLFVESDGRPKMVLIRRSQFVTSHKGEISFPGGAQEQRDVTLEQTALRETEEEIGIPESSVKVIGRLDEVKTTSGFLVTPFLGILDWPCQFLLSRDEVDELLTVDLEAFLLPENQIEFYYFNGRLLQPQIAYRIDSDIVWGATARIIANLLELTLESSGSPTGEAIRKLHLAC